MGDARCMDFGELTRAPSEGDPVPPGWYSDPWQVAPSRWWDGATWTGYVSPPNAGSGAYVGLGGQAQFVGGMNVPSSLGGRLNATIPLARLTVGEGKLTMQPRSFARMFTEFEVPLKEIASAFPLTGTFMTSGVGFELSDSQLAYFWTLGDKGRILALLQNRGVRVDPVARRAAGALLGQLGFGWKLDGSPSSVAKVPGYSRTMTALFPLFLVAGLVVLVIFATTGDPFAWFLVAIGTVSIVRMLVLWQRHRKR